MSLEVKELVVGAALGVAVLLVFRFARIHRERGSYAVLLAAITLPYVMFAIESHETDALHQTAISVAFIAIAVLGARYNLWLVVFGFAAHAVYDAVMHHTSLMVATPGWYGPVCLGFDLVLAMGLAGFLAQGDKLSDMT